MASRSAVIPAFVMLPLIQNQYAHGLAESGGCRNVASRLARAAGAGNNRSATVRIIARDVAFRRLMRSFISIIRLQGKACVILVNLPARTARRPVSQRHLGR